MTAKKKVTTKAGRKGKAAGARVEDRARAESSEMMEYEINRPTPEEAGQLAASLVTTLAGDGCRQVARFLLLCTALTYAPDMTAREEMLLAVRKHAAPELPGFGQLIEGDLRNALGELREDEKGGAR